MEKRRNKRVPVTLNLEISSVFKQDNVRVSNLNTPIEITDISRSGIGFLAKSILPVGFYFNARLVFEQENNALNCVVQILRQEDLGDGIYKYGCAFVGLSSVFDYIFDEFEEANDEQ